MQSPTHALDPAGRAQAAEHVALPIVVAERVSKRFTLHHARIQTVKERVLSLLRRSNGPPNDEVFDALHEVSFTVREGEAVALVGRNGSGKSTLLKLIAGVHQATSGRLLVRTGLRIATMIELGVGFHPELTGRENVYLNAAIHGLSRAEIDAIYPVVVSYAELDRFMDNAIKTYSSGMVMRLAFSISINLNPDVFLLDEIFAVGDEMFQQKCLRSMRAFQEQGKTMFFVSHSADAVREMCRRAIVLEHGDVEFDGDVEAGIRTYRRILGHEPSLTSGQAHKSEVQAVDEGREQDWHRRIVGGLFDEAGAHHLDFLRRQGLKPSDHVLDLGCGILRTGVPLLKYLDPGHYVGVDSDSALLEAGLTIELPRAGIDAARGHYFVSSSTDLANVEGLFDVIWCVGLLQDLRHELAAVTFAAALQKLAPGGRMFVAYFEAPEFLSLQPIERPGPCFSYFDRAPRHFDFATLGRYAEAAGGHVERLGEWGDPHGQTMLVLRRV